MTSIADNQPKVERVDDTPVIYGVLERMGIEGIVDEGIKAHGNWQGLSPGQVIVVWLMHILSEQNRLYATECTSQESHAELGLEA